MLFRDKGCTHCHTINGVGGNKAPDLSGVGKRLKEPLIQKQIVEGGKEMPAFGDSLDANEIRDLVEYLHKCRKKVDSGWSNRAGN